MNKENREIKPFLINFIVFVISFLILFVIVYEIVFYLNNYEFFKSDKNTVYLTGDSQLYQGIDKAMLSKLIHKKVISTAKHGNGVYDFLAFSIFVPKGSTCVLNLSQLAEIRYKKRDRNTMGLSFKALYVLIKNHYTFLDIYNIIKRNIKPRKIITKKHDIYPPVVSIKKIKKLENRFRKLMNYNKTYLQDKQNIYYTAIKNLIDKNCKIILVDFPCHKDCESIMLTSRDYPKLHAFQNKIISDFNLNVDTVKLDTNKIIYADFKDTLNVKPDTIFYDWSHLNRYGATIYTEFIAKRLENLDSNTIILSIWEELAKYYSR